jgi:hypothetical protein
MSKITQPFQAAIQLVLVLSVLVAAQNFAHANSPFQAPDFAGVYKFRTAKGTTVLELKHEANGAVFGTITDAQFRIQLNGQLQGDAVAGRAYLVEGDKRFVFLARKKNGNIAIGFSGVDANWKADNSQPITMMFYGEGSSQEPAGANEDETTASSQQPTRTTYKHPLGFTFESVPGWTVEQTSNQKVILKPGDIDKNETIVVTAQPIRGASRANSAEFITAVDQDMATNFPLMARTGNPELIQTTIGTGVLIVYQGVSQVGLRSQLRFYAVMVGGNAFGIIAVGPAKVVAARDPELRQVFVSLKIERTESAMTESASAAGSGATPLAQQWIQHLSGRKLTYLSSYSSGGSSSLSERHWYLAPNGSFSFSSQSSSSIYVDGANGGSNGTNSGKGSWRIYAADNQAYLELLFNDGRTVRYSLSLQNGKTFFNRDKIYVQ